MPSTRLASFSQILISGIQNATTERFDLPADRAGVCLRLLQLRHITLMQVGFNMTRMVFLTMWRNGM